MYIKIGTTNIKYLTSQDDFMIFSEVVNSKLSYEKPTLVRTSDELDIWFGKSFSDRDYLAELLESGVTLFLYRPISSEINDRGDDYIDYLSYREDPILYYSNIELPEVGEERVKYKVYSLNGVEIDESTSSRFNYWIWHNSSYIDTSQLPQNIDSNNTSSINNRDVLSINYIGYSGPKYVYPEYQGEDIESKYEIDNDLLLSNLPDLNRVNLGYETLCYYVKFSKSIDFGVNKSESPYIIISTKLKENILIYFNSGKGIPTSVDKKYYNSNHEIIVLNKDRDQVVEEFIEYIDDLGYKTNIVSDEIFQIYTSFKTDVNYFYNIEDFYMIPDFNGTHDILSKLSLNDRRIEFTSRTIGTDIDNLIKIKIEYIKSDSYRVTISRFEYSEIFEGCIFDRLNRIDYKINSESKLVRCRLTETYTDSNGRSVRYKMNPNIDDGERESLLPEGEWYLRRGKEEDYDYTSYWKSLNSIFNDGDTIMFDYLLVPDIKKYTNGLDPDYDYYKEYLDFLDYSKLINCQILIQNSDSDYKIVEVSDIPSNPEPKIVYKIPQKEGGYKFFILNSSGVLEETFDREIINTYGNDYVFNYTGDKENRIIYFYRPMTVLGNDRPAYYVYLDGLLKDTYSSSVKYINYDSPVKDPYLDYENIELSLEKYKSNYLVDNNQIYYYKKYQNGNDYITTGWMRFCMGKISREISKNKWKFLSERISGNIKNLILDILKKVSDSFSIIRGISLTNFKINYEEYKIELTIEAYMSDLIGNNISLDITLNYNK